MRLFYILYTWLFFVPVFLVLTILTAVTTIVGCLLGGEKIFSYYPGMIWSRLTCYLALCPIKVRGREHLQPGKSYIFAANHQGAFDIFLIYGFLGVPIKWVMKAGIGKIPFVAVGDCSDHVERTFPCLAYRFVEFTSSCYGNGDP